MAVHRSALTDELTYSPLLALYSAYDRGHYGFDEPLYYVLNLVDAMAAVEAEHPEVLETREPLAGRDAAVTEFGKGLLTKDEEQLIDNLYYKDGTTEVDEDAIAYPAQERHQGLAKKAVQVYGDYFEYLISSLLFGSDVENIVDVRNADLYSYIYIPASVDALGVSSFKLSGTVTVNSEATYLPVRVWRSLDVYVYMGDGDDLILRTGGMGNDEVAASMPALPDYSLTDAKLNAEIAQLQTDTAKGTNVPKVFRSTTAETDGRLGESACVPTSEKYGVFNILGTDTVRTPQFTSQIFLAAEDEDGCDQSDVLVTICDDEPTQQTPPSSTEPNGGSEVNTGGSSVSTDSQQSTASSAVVSESQSLSRTGASVVGVQLLALLLLGTGAVIVWRVKRMS